MLVNPPTPYLVASANLTRYVNASTGSDTLYDGTSATVSGTSGPFATIQHAANILSLYNYFNQYSGTISVANGTYNEQVELPFLFNDTGAFLTGNHASPTSVTIADTGTDFCLSNWGAQWSIDGFNFGGTFGGIYGGAYSSLHIETISFSGNYATEAMIHPDVNCVIEGIGATITTTATTGQWFIFSRGFIVIDGAAITHSNAITLAHGYIWGDSTTCFVALDGTTIANGSNVTCSQNCLVMSSGAYIESDSTTLVDGSPMTRANFPGHASGFNLFPDGSVFQMDSIVTGTTLIGKGPTGTLDPNSIYLNDGVGNRRADYGVNQDGWSFYCDQGSTVGIIKNTASGGTDPQVYFVDGDDFTDIPFIGTDASVGNTSNLLIGGYIGAQTPYRFNTITGKFTIATTGGGLYLPAGTTSAAPLNLTSGTNLTTAAAGTFEYDGKAIYGTTVASSRQVVDAEQVQVLSSNRTFTNNTSAQAIFNASTNGAITLAGSTTYEFEMLVVATGFSGSAHTINLGFALSGGASVTSIGYYYNAQAGSTLATPTTSLSGFIATNSATAIIASATTTGLTLYVRGTIRINAGGTVTPQFTQVTNSAAAVVQTNSFVRFWPVGTNTVTNVGNWS